MNVFFSADWETASDTETERGNEGARKGEIYAAAEAPTIQQNKLTLLNLWHVLKDIFG